MCGVAGVFRYNPAGKTVCEESLLQMREAMAARGPDGAGMWVSPDRSVGLAHRRLAIIDCSPDAAQPMKTEDGALRIIFNGEIYNHVALRTELEAKGYRFRTRSDTEVLLHLYADRGMEMFSALRGMYAFALWDEKRQGLLLARGPFGVKQLYVADDGRTMRFASQVKALLAGGEVDTAPDPAGHVGFFLWGFVPHPFTLYRGVRPLPAGGALWVDAHGGRREFRHADVADEIRQASQEPWHGTPEEMHERLGAALRDSVRHHLVADVPVSVFLSAGLDSSTLTALATEVGGRPMHTVTLGFDEFRNTELDEAPLAEMVARHYGACHSTCRIPGSAFRAQLPDILAAMDQPTIDGVNSYFVSQAAASTGAKVALSGLGGDELFGGYSSFRHIPRLVRLLGPLRHFPALGRGFRWVSAPLLKSCTYPKYAGLLEYGTNEASAYLLRRGLVMPWELPDVLDPDMVREGWRTLQPLVQLEEAVRGVRGAYCRVASLELTWYMRDQLLRDTDWAGMAHGVEVRVPFVDMALLREVAPLFNSAAPPTKADMANTPVRSLPPEILSKHKTGFAIPVNDWLKPSQPQRAPGKVRGWAKAHRGWAERVYAAFTNGEHFRSKSLLLTYLPVLLGGLLPVLN